MMREEDQPIWARAPGLVAARMAMADWERSLGKEMERVRPFLVKCVGEFTATYPQPGSGLRLVVQRRGRMIIAFPHPEDLDPARDLILTERDVQLWRVDWGKTGQKTVDGQWAMGDGKPEPETGSQKSGAHDDRRTTCDAKVMQARECASHFEQMVSGTGGGGPRVRVNVTVDADGFCGGPHPSETTNRCDGRRSMDGGARSHSRLQPSPNWHEVVWEGETISLRKREKAKDFLRLLWNKGARCRSKAVAVGKAFQKPSSLFAAGERWVDESAGVAGRENPVGSELGAVIHRLYRDAVGKVPPATKGAGPTKYYLRVFPESDNT